MADKAGCPCTTVKTLLDSVASLVNDRQHVRWSMPTLLEFLNEGLGQVYAHRPEAFTYSTTLTLRPGVSQSAGPGVELVGIERNITYDEAGNEVAGEMVATSDRKFSSALNGKPTCVTAAALCGSNGKTAPYAVRSVALDPAMLDAFDVTPAVPAGAAPKVQATINGAPCIFCIGDMDKCIGIALKYEAPLREWMIFRAFGTEAESQFEFAAGQKAFANFYQMLGVQVQRRAQYNTDVANGVRSPRMPATGFSALENKR